MSDITIPHPERKRALILVGVHKGFVKDENAWILANIQEVIKNGEYSLIVETVFNPEEEVRFWDKKTRTDEVQRVDTSNYVGEKVLVTKNTKSAFKGDIDLARLLVSRGIEENHIVGIDTEDCVFATAQESADLGFHTYVLEECTESSKSFEDRSHALKLLQHHKMTNTSPHIESKKIVKGLSPQ